MQETAIPQNQRALRSLDANLIEASLIHDPLQFKRVWLDPISGVSVVAAKRAHEFGVILVGTWKAHECAVVFVRVSDGHEALNAAQTLGDALIKMPPTIASIEARSLFPCARG